MRRLFIGLVVVLSAAFLLQPIQTRHFMSYLVISDVLYAAAVYLIVAIVFGRPHPLTGRVALLFCLGIEFFKITGIPAQLWRYPVARWIFGTTFSVTNLLIYPIGIVTFGLIDRYWFRPTKKY